MPDTFKTTESASDEVETSHHDGARHLAEAAERSADDVLLDQAMHTDPEALANVLAEDGPALPQDAGAASDEDVEAISRAIKPDADAPSRAGISGSGSGADNM